MRTSVLLLLATFMPTAFSPVAAQPTDSSPFTPSAVWSSPTQSSDSYRTGNGHPGPNYWQNHVEYSIEARLDTTAHRIRGSVQYTYTNNSPTPLQSIWLLTGGSSPSSLVDSSKVSSSSASAPIQISDVSVDGAQNSATTVSTDTRTQIRFRSPVAPRGGTVTFTLQYHVPISLEGKLPTRMYAPSGVLYEIGHWYPRVAVYSEQHGWAEVPARRSLKALSEYGSYDYSLTVPANLIVAGSGTLMNSDSVLTSDQRRRLMRARDSHRKVAIITPDQTGHPDTRPQQSGLLTWSYQMNGVRDVAWAASPAFIWNATRINRKEKRDGLAMSFYPRSSMGGQAWNRSTYHIQKGVEFLSDRLMTYPWNTMVNVAGPVSLRSFPGLSFCSRSAAGYRLFACTIQNLSQNWFSVMASANEERHPWMNKGLRTALSVLAHRTLYEGEFSPKQDAAFAPKGNAPAEGLLPLMTAPDASSITTPPALQDQQWRSTLTSYKPAYGLLLLREYILSPNRFDYALRQYVQRWAYRQPTPEDFFHAINDATGTDLSWFWTGWFRHSWAVDQAITNVSYVNDTPSDGAVVTFELKRKLPMPVEATITESDGDTHHLRLPVEVWQQGATYTARLTTDSRLRTIQLDPNGQLPDVNPRNDTWSSQHSPDRANRTP
ncbi:hypothetical protein [Salinibacter sp. 10B]|uniref:hypothetical protein n=1 Tax=Salinibacter sp. 10B TaxID=1923971 RepID=UPI0011B0E4F2|nr:hypothetical protein [Salinibacter sp. 10B]